MPKKCLKPAKGVRSVPQIGSRYGRHKDSQSSSSSSLSTRSSTSTIKQLKKAQLAEKKAAEEASRLGGEPTTNTPRHLVSHMLPYFYPNDYEYDPTEDDTSIEMPRHLVSHITTYCYPMTGTIDDENVLEPRPDVVPPHLESHVAPYCQPVNEDGAVIEWPDFTQIDESTRHKISKSERANYDPRHLKSHLFDSGCNFEGDGKAEHRTGIRCEMTRDHANMRDTVFADDNKPLRRVGGRRPVANQCNLFEESKPKPRPMSITIVQRAPENTKDNIFGSESSTSHSRRRWENDTMKTIFGLEEDDTKETITSTLPRSRRYENTTEKLFGETYGIKEVEEEQARRRRPLREDTKMTLFGPPTTPTPQRPQSAQSFTSTHENLFGSLSPTQSSRRTLHRENTFDNLFGVTPVRSVIATGINERYTTKSPKIVQASLSSVK